MKNSHIALLTAALLPNFLTAQEIEEIVVQSSALAKSASEVVGALNIMDSRELQREASSTLGGTLHNQIGVASGSFGPGVGVPVIRGQSGKRVEILQNNSSVGDVSDTSSDHAVATETLLADRIEILRGPATLKYGPGAIGGVVNIIDNRIHSEVFDGTEGAVEVRYNNNSNERALVARSDTGMGDWVFHLDGVTRDSGNVDIPGLANPEADDPDETTNGFIANSDADSQSIAVGLSWIGDTTHAGLSFNRLQNNYGIPPGAHAHHEEPASAVPEEEAFVRLDMSQNVWQAEFGMLDLPGFLEDLSISLDRSDYQHNEIEIEGNISAIGTRFVNDTSAIGLELTHEPMGEWRGVLGLHAQEDRFNAIGDEAFVPQSKTSMHAIYLVEETSLSNATLELGARVDWQKIDSPASSTFEDDIYNLSSSLLIPLGDEQRLSFIASRAQRAPVAQELLAQGEHVATGTYEIGNANLSPETSTNLELSYAYEGAFNFRASLYQNRFADYIYERDTELLFNHDLADGGAVGLAACTNEAGFDTAEEAEEALECFIYSQEDARFTGLEVETELFLGESQRLRVWGDMVRGRFESNTDIPRQPPARLGLSWNYEKETWSGQLSLLKAFDQDRPGEGQEATEGYVRLDGFISYAWGDADLFLRGTNLTDEEIRNSTSFLREVAPEPGRSLTLGVTYSF